MHRPLVCAHRGASGLAPENTLAALRLARELGVDMVEIDVQLSADRRPVVIHDATLERTTDGAGAVAARTLAELRRLDAGAWFAPEFAGERMPTLDEVLDLAGRGLRLNIELKPAGDGEELADVVVRAVTRRDLAGSCLVTSFDHGLVDRLAAMCPDIRRGYILPRSWIGGAAAAVAAPVDVISAARELVDDALVASVRRAGKELHVWTVNETAGMRRLCALGVDAVITDHPDRLLALFRDAPPPSTGRR